MKGKIFNAQEVQSLISGNKTQFREVIKLHLEPNGRDCDGLSVDEKGKLVWYDDDSGWYKDYDDVKCPYQVGQKIFVKEVFCKSIFGKAIYKDEEKEIRGLGGREVVVKWKPAQHMKQEHSRLTLLIKEIRVERLADISGEDAINEGFNYGTNLELSQLRFFENWNATHKKPEEKFKANPWVWVINFEVVK
jgi:hypothetical protein